MMRSLPPLTIPTELESTLDDLLSSSHDKWNQVWDTYVTLNEQLYIPSPSPLDSIAKIKFLDNALITPPLDPFQAPLDLMDSFRPEFYEDFHSDASDNVPINTECDKLKPPRMPEDAYFPIETSEGPKFQCAHPGCTKSNSYLI
jgi:hypothetical protein